MIGADSHLDALAERRRVPVGGLIATILVATGIAAAFERIGIGSQTIALIIGITVLAAMLIAALAARTLELAVFTVGARDLTSRPGIAAAVGGLVALQPASLVLFFAAMGRQGLWLAVAWTGGLLAANVLAAGFLRRAGAATLAGFLGARYASPAVRRATALVVALSAVALAAAATIGAAGSAAALFDLEPATAAGLVVAPVLAVALLGGSRAAQAVAAIAVALLAVAVLGLFVALLAAEALPGLPSFLAAAADRGVDLAPAVSGNRTGSSELLLHTAGLAACFAFQPLVLAGAPAAPGVASSRRAFASASAIGFAMLLATACVALVVRLAGVEALGVTQEIPALIELAGRSRLPATTGGLLLGALMLFAIAGAALALVTASATIGNDLLVRANARSAAASSARRLHRARLATILIAVLIALAGRAGIAELPWVATTAGFGLAPAALAAPLLAGIWWRGATARGALAALAAAALAYGLWVYGALIDFRFGTAYLGMANGLMSDGPSSANLLPAVIAGVTHPFGLPLAGLVVAPLIVAAGALAVLIAVSLADRRSSGAAEAFLEAIRGPGGRGAASEEEQA